MEPLRNHYNITKENSTEATPAEGFEGEPRILIAAIVEVLISIVGSTGNLLTCLAVIRNTSLQFATNFFIVSLAVADLLVCTILVPMRASQHFSFFLGKDDIHPLAVQVAGFLGRVNIVASICSLAALSIDRCIAIKYPMRYRFDIRYATRRVIGVILAFWVFAIVFTSLPYVPGITDDVFLIGFIVFVLFVTVIIMLAYFRIFHVANKSRIRRKVGVVDIDLEETTPKHKNSKKALHVHFSASCRSHDVSSKKKPGNLKKVKLQPLAASRLHGIPPKARSSFSSKVVEAQTLTSTPQLQPWEDNSRVARVTPNLAANPIHTRRITNGNEQGSRNANAYDSGKRIDKSLVRRHSTLRQTSKCTISNENNCTASSETNAQSAYTITLREQIFECSSTTLTHPANLYVMGTSQAAEQLKFPSSQPQGDSENSLKAHPVQHSNYMTAMKETKDSYPACEFEEMPSKPMQPELQGLTENHSSQQKLCVEVESSQSTAHLQRESDTDHLGAQITNSQEDDSIVQRGLQNVHSLRKNLNNQLDDNMTNIKEGSVQAHLRRVQNSPSMKDSEEQRRIKKDRHKDHKTTKTIAIVIGCFIALVYPRIIMILYHYGNKPSPASLLAKFWVRILLYTNSAVNPLLYAWRMREFRDEFSKIIFAFFRCGRTPSKVRIHPSQAVSTQSTTALSTDLAVAH